MKRFLVDLWRYFGCLASCCQADDIQRLSPRAGRCRRCGRHWVWY